MEAGDRQTKIGEAGGDHRSQIAGSIHRMMHKTPPRNLASRSYALVWGRASLFYALSATLTTCTKAMYSGISVILKEMRRTGSAQHEGRPLTSVNESCGGSARDVIA